MPRMDAWASLNCGTAKNALDRQPVLVESGNGHAHRVAQLDFQLKEPARSIEYRFYVNPDVQMTLERVELFSGLAIPAE